MLESLFNKVAGPQAVKCNFVKKELQYSCFALKFTKFLRTPFFEEHLRRAASEFRWIQTQRWLEEGNSVIFARQQILLYLLVNKFILFKFQKLYFLPLL